MQLASGLPERFNHPALTANPFRANLRQWQRGAAEYMPRFHGELGHCARAGLRGDFEKSYPKAILYQTFMEFVFYRDTRVFRYTVFSDSVQGFELFHLCNNYRCINYQLRTGTAIIL